MSIPTPSSVEQALARCARTSVGELRVETFGRRPRDRATRRPSVSNASFVAYRTTSVPRLGRNAAAVRRQRPRETSRRRSRSSSGAVKPRWRIWFRHLMRVSRAERFATSNTRIASTLPSAVFAIPDARPDNAARAASIASTVSDFPARRRADGSDDQPRSPRAPAPRGSGPSRRRTRRCPQPPPAAASPNPTSHACNAPISRRRGRERLHAQHAAARVHRGRDMHIQMGIDSARDRARALYDGHRHPFCSQTVKGWHARPGKETVTSTLRQQRARSPSGTGRAQFHLRTQTTSISTTSMQQRVRPTRER